MLNKSLSKRTAKKTLSLVVLIYFVFLQTAYPALAAYTEVTGPTIIVEGTEQLFKMDMARDSSGNLNVVSIVQGIEAPIIKYYSYNGSWSAPMGIYNMPAGITYHDVKVAVNPVTDDPWVTWWAHSSDYNTTSFQYTYKSGGSWQGPFTVNADAPFGLAPIDIAFYSNGDPIIVSGREGDGGFDYYDWSGSAFNNPVHVSKALGVIAKLEVEIYGSEASGDIHVFGLPSLPGGNTSTINYVHGALSSGEYTWDDPFGALDFAAMTGLNLDTHILASGVVSLTTNYSEPGPGDSIYYRNRSQAGTWSSVRTVSSGILGPGDTLGLYESSDGTAYLSYTKTLEEDKDLVMKYSTDSGATWSNEVMLNSNDNQLVGNMIALTEGSSELILVEFGMTDGPPDLRYYSVTAAGGGGGGEGVPEFSTYMFILTITAGLGAIYYSNNKNQGVAGA